MTDLDEALEREAARRAPQDIIELAQRIMEDQDRRRVAPPPARVDASALTAAVREAQRRERARRPRAPRIRADRAALLALAKAGAELAARNDEAIVPASLRRTEPQTPSARPRQPWRDG